MTFSWLGSIFHPGIPVRYLFLWTLIYFMTQQDHFRMTLSCQRSSILVGFSLINHLILGIPHFGKHPYNNRFAWERHNRSPMWSTVTRSSRTGAEKSTETVQRNPLRPSTWGETWGDHYITVDVNKDRCIYVAKPRHLPYVFIYIYTYIYIYKEIHIYINKQICVYIYILHYSD